MTQLALLTDRNRTLKYQYAIFKAIKKGDIVIDFGCGTGILGFFALQAGAQHIYAIEETPIINHAHKLAQLNNLTEKITFIEKPGLEITKEDIPAKIDAILSEPMSNLLLEGNSWSALEHVKQFLKHDGMILPQSASLLIIPVSATPDYYQFSQQVLELPNLYNLNFADLPDLVFYQSDISEKDWLSQPQNLLNINLRQDPLRNTFRAAIEFRLEHSGEFSGLEFFFKANIFDDITLSSREKQSYFCWTPLFAPLPQKITVLRGDLIKLTVANEFLNPIQSIWTIDLTITSKLLSPENNWWFSQQTIPKIAPNVIKNDNRLVYFEKDRYYQYDSVDDLEADFINLFLKSCSCQEICRRVYESRPFNLSYEEIYHRLIQLIHNLQRYNLIELPIAEKYWTSNHFQLKLYFP